MSEQNCTFCGTTFYNSEIMPFCSGICRHNYENRILEEAMGEATAEQSVAKLEFLASRMTPVEEQQYYMLRDNSIEVIICENGWVKIQCASANASFEEPLQLQKYE